MKISLAITALILLIGGWLGISHQQRLAHLKEDQAQLVSQAAKLGISANRSDGERAARAPRGGRVDTVASLVAKLIAQAKESKLQEKNGEPASSGKEKYDLELIRQLLSLSATELKSLIAALQNDQTLPLEDRQGIIHTTLLLMTEDRPGAVVALLSQSPDLVSDSDIGSLVWSSSLGAWAKKDPGAALAWMSENSKNHPELADDVAKSAIIGGAAQTDLKLAMKWIGEMNPDDLSTGASAIIDTAKTPEQRTAVLTALREQFSKFGDPEQRDAYLSEALENMGRSISDEGYDSVQSWLATSKLTPQESAKFAAGLYYDQTKQDTGRWVEWMSATLPKDELDDSVDGLVGQWTQQDYQAAGKWLSATPDGPAKNAAVSSYATTVAEYEPQTAAQWALTLPAGKQRQETLESIYENWPKKDSVARDAFAQQHGIPRSR
jgi:hypothetical protein